MRTNGWRSVVSAVALGAMASFSGCDCSPCLYDDDNSCTIDQCVDEESVHEALPDGSLCQEKSGQIGTCHNQKCVVLCEGPGDCDDNNPCTADGCQFELCVHIKSDALQGPSDGNPCTEDICSNGKALHKAMNGAPCNNGVCQFDECGSCTTAADCGNNTACLMWECKAGACLKKPIAAGVEIKNGDMPYDCRRHECDGFGSIVDLPDVQDEPLNDSDACTIEGCYGWTPTHTNVADGTFCPGGVCSMGECVECIFDYHCGKNYCWNESCWSCEDEVQNGNETGIDCGGSCVVKCLGDPCTMDDECQSGHCSDGVCCDISCGTCLTCTEPGLVGYCQFVPKYQEDFPVCSMNNSSCCNGGGVCKTALGFNCSNDFQCVSGICKNGICAAVP